MNKFRQNKHFVTFVCLFLGAILLCSAAVANIGNAGGYAAYKNGLISLLSLDNCSGSIDFTLLFDDQEVITFRYVEQLDRNAKPGEAMVYYANELEDSLTKNWTVVNPENHITGMPYTRYNYVQAHTMDDASSWSINSASWTGGQLSDMHIDVNDEYNARVIRLLEAAADLFVGDLKNNFVYLGGSNGESTYRISLSGSQLPEIINAAIPFVFAEYAGTNYGYTNTVMTSLDFEWPDVADQEWDNKWMEAWDKASAMREEKPGVYVIYSDFSIERFNSEYDYYSTVNMPLEAFLEHPSVFFTMIDGDPVIDTATCELTVDSEGRLTNNILEGTVAVKLHNGERHTITLRVEGNLTDIGTTKISLPVIDPKDTVYDRSYACAENGYEYTVTQNGITTTHTQDQEDKMWERQRFYEMSPLDRFCDAANYIIYDGFGVSVVDSPDTESQYIYPAGPDTYFVVDKELFEENCDIIFSSVDEMMWYAENKDLTAGEVTAQLLMDYKVITGEDYEGATAWAPEDVPIVVPESGNSSEVVDWSGQGPVEVPVDMSAPQVTSEPLDAPVPTSAAPTPIVSARPTTAPGSSGDC